MTSELIRSPIRSLADQREIIPIESEGQWLGLREKDCTSTMTPALFGLSPYLTVFELYHAKKTGVHVPFEKNERMRKGLAMEQYAANEVAAKRGAIARKINEYIRIPDIRMGSSFDYELVYDDGRPPELLELKAVDWLRWKATWGEDDAPDDKEIQIQHQFECADKWESGLIAVFTGIYDWEEYPRTRDREFGAVIRGAVQKFWDDVAAGREPNPDFYRDADVIAALYPKVEGDLVNYTGDVSFEALVAEFDRLKAEEKQVEKDITAAKAKIHLFLKEAPGAYTDRFKVTTAWTSGSPGTLITPDMVGTYIGARSGYRQCLVKDLTKGKGEK